MSGVLLPGVGVDAPSDGLTETGVGLDPEGSTLGTDPGQVWRSSMEVVVD